MKNLFYIIVVVAVLAGAWLAGKWLRPAAVPSVQAMTVSPCNPVVTQCEAVFADQTLRLHFLEPPSALKPFAVRLQTSAVIDDAYMEFGMHDMEMGFNRAAFHSEQPGWQARVILPVCTTGRRDWIVTLLIEYQGQWWRGEFDFVTE